MEYRKFGRSGREVSVLGMGTYYDPLWITVAALTGIRRKAARKIEALNAGLDAGVNLIDTAELYFSEELVGEAIKGRKRDELFIATKVSYLYHFSYDGVIKACEASIRRLGCKYVDLYQVHFPYRFSKIKEMMRGMERLLEMGNIMHIGVSNFSLRQLKEAQEALQRYEIVSNQANYSMANREIEKELLPYCEKEGIAIVAYYPLAHGRLINANSIAARFLNVYEGKTPAQIALNWLISRSEVVFPIPRASNPAHVLENCGAAGWRISKEHLDALALKE